MLLKNCAANTLTFLVLFQLIVNTKSDEDGVYTIKNKFRFPYGPIQGPFMGIFLALSLPLELPDIDVFFSYNFEANYVLPQNETEFTYPPLVSKRSWDRKFFYDILEFKLKSHGFPGRFCLLRTICESAMHSPEHTGVLGDILHVLLTPSTSNDSVLDDYQKAEERGKTLRNCKMYKRKCSISILDLISKVTHYLEI